LAVKIQPEVEIRCYSSDRTLYCAANYGLYKPCKKA